MQEASQTDDAGIRIRERDRVLWARTQAFAALLLFIIFWTMSIWIYRARVENPESDLPADLVVDLNDATQAELNLLPGVGAKLASDILKYRDEVGGFQSVDEIMNIRGIKEGRLLSLKKYLTVSVKTKLTK